jgi:hypothetical protein
VNQSITNTLTNTASAGFAVNGNWLGPEGITAIATCLAALFGFLALMSVYLLQKQIRSDHDRSRRERAVDLMTVWATSQDPTCYQIVFGLSLLHSLTKEQCHALWNREAFGIEVRNQSLLDSWRAACCFNSQNRSKKTNVSGSGNNSQLTLSDSEVLMLRSIASVTLNKLELVASAWHNNVADRQIIEREFIKLYCPKDGAYVLENFREASGIYPSIGKICEHYKNKKNESLAAKPPIAE